jgi:hypothetical protein
VLLRLRVVCCVCCVRTASKADCSSIKEASAVASEEGFKSMASTVEHNELCCCSQGWKREVSYGSEACPTSDAL